MNKSFIMIMGGALAVAVLVAVMVQSMLSGGEAKEDLTSVQILVANKKLLVGEKIKAKDVRWQRWPEAAAFKGVIKKSDHQDEKELFVYNTPLRRTLQSGEPVTTHAVIADLKGGNNFLAASIAPGMRAMSVAVKPESSVGGFLAPGDYVDVVMSYKPRLDRELEDFAKDIVQQYASQTVLSNVKVLAVDQEAKAEGREAKVYKTVTLEVTRAQGEKLSLALTMGKISLALRRLGEQDTADDKSPGLTTDTRTSSVIKKVRQLKNKAETTSNVIRVYSGTVIENVPVRGIDPMADMP